ncbi:MAG: glycosyltransferase family 2 protein [Balneolaceae bacterium]
MQSSTTFSVIIVTWNALHHLKRFLPGVYETDYNQFEIILADNASTDHSRKWVKDNYPDCKIVSLDKNYGYAGGNNRAAQYAKNEVLIFLNNDTRPDPNWLTQLSESFKRENADIVQPKIRSIDAPDHFEYAGAAGGYIDRFGYPFCRGRIFDSIEKDTGQYDDIKTIFWASGAAFAIKKDLFQQLDGFDESFEFHMEEIDLCWRALKLDKRIIYEPKSIVYHLGGGSMSEDSPRKIYFNYRNNLLMLVKNLDRFLIPKLCIRLVLDGFSGIRFLFQFKPRHIWAIVKSHFSFYRMLPAALNERNRLQESAKNPTPESLVYQNLLPIDYFIWKRKKFTDLKNFNP